MAPTESETSAMRAIKMVFVSCQADPFGEAIQAIQGSASIPASPLSSPARYCRRKNVGDHRVQQEFPAGTPCTTDNHILETGRRELSSHQTLSCLPARFARICIWNEMDTKKLAVNLLSALQPNGEVCQLDLGKDRSPLVLQ